MVAPSLHPASLPDDVLWSQCEIRRQRRSGPGGQHRNKVETAIFLRHLPSQLEVAASERRSQDANRRMALKRLRLKLAVNVRCAKFARERPSPLWQQRVGGSQLAVRASHPDLTLLVAEALDFLAAEGWEPVPAAARLGCTATRLIKILSKVPAAWQTLNAVRKELGLHPLHMPS